MNSSSTQDTTQWVTDWLDRVVEGSTTMSQRKRTSVDKKGGGIAAVQAVAEQKGVHLLLLEDDEGNEFVAASTKPFQVLC